MTSPIAIDLRAPEPAASERRAQPDKREESGEFAALMDAHRPRGQVSNAEEQGTDAGAGEASGKPRTDSARQSDNGPESGDTEEKTAKPEAAGDTADLDAQKVESGDSPDQMPPAVAQAALAAGQAVAVNAGQDSSQGPSRSGDRQAIANGSRPAAKPEATSAQDDDAEKAAKTSRSGQAKASFSGQRVEVSGYGVRTVARPGGPIDAATAVAATQHAIEQAGRNSGKVSAEDGSPPGRTATKAESEQAASLRQALEADEPVRSGRDRERSDAVSRSRASWAHSERLGELRQQAQGRSDPPGLANRVIPGDPQTARSQVEGQHSADARAQSASAPGSPSNSVTAPSGQGFDPVMNAASPTGQGNGVTGTDATARGAATQSASRPSAPQPLPDQVAVQIQRAVGNGQQRLSIRLHPAELGRIDVRLNLSDDGAVRATLSVDRPDTLELIQRDLRGLEKALNDAGLKTDQGSLSFNLRGGEDGSHQRSGDGRTASSGAAGHAEAEESQPAAEPVGEWHGREMADSRVDIRV